MNTIQTSGIDFTTQFSLQSLCIDNEKIRKRIIENKQIQVTSVPCLLLIFPDGGIEKYDGGHAFEWVEDIIRKFAPPQQPQPQQSEEENWRKQQAIEQQKLSEEKNKINKERSQTREKNRKKYEKQYEGFDTDEDERERPTTPTKKNRIKREQVTPIDELPSDEDDEVNADRYRSKRPVGRIRIDEGNYEDGDELFKGQKADTRRSLRSAVKGDNHVGNDATSKKTADLMTKAKELAKGRQEPGPPKGHPQNQLLN